MIFYEQQYREYLAKAGVGSNDKVASSIDSYVSYLRSVSEVLGIDISPATVHDEECVQNIFHQLQGKRSEKTISNYRSALRLYAQMVHIDYDVFFETTEMLLRQNLPAGLTNFSANHPDKKGWLVVKFPRFKRSQYELHFSNHSGHHAEYFGKGPHITIAFYYEKLGDHDIWLNALNPHLELVQEQLGRKVITGQWSDNWVWAAECLDGEAITPENLSALFGQFIQATYGPFALTFKAIGR